VNRPHATRKQGKEAAPTQTRPKMIGVMPTPRSRQFIGIERRGETGILRKGDVIGLFTMKVTPFNLHQIGTNRFASGYNVLVR